MVGIMIVAGQVEHAVQHKHLEFLRGGMAVAARVVAGNLSADGDVASVFAGERKNVRGFVLAAKAAVQLLDAAAAGDEHGNFAAHTGEPLRFAGKAFQAGASGAIQSLFKDDHKLA